MVERLRGSVFVILVFVLMVVLPEEGTRLVVLLCFAMAMIEVVVAWSRSYSFRFEAKDALVFAEVLVLTTAIVVTLGIFPVLLEISRFDVVTPIFGEGAELVRSLNKNDLLFVIMICALADAGGYLTGYFVERFGRRHKVKFLARISPNKSWEGYVGMLVASWVVGSVLIATHFVPLDGSYILFTVYGGVFAALGDLLGSACKRALGLDNSGDALKGVPVLGFFERLLDGHGGALDRMDSIALGMVVFAAAVL